MLRVVRNVLLAVVAMAGLSRETNAETLRFLSFSGTVKAPLAQALIPAFEKETGVKVDVTFLPQEALTQKAMTEFISGAPSFDAILFEMSWGGAFAPFLDDLAPRIAKLPPEFEYDDFVPRALDMSSYKGKKVGLPYSFTARIFHYRKDMFEKYGIDHAPRNWNELIDAAKKLTLDEDNDGNPDFFGIALYGRQGHVNAFEFGSFLFSNGGAWYDLDRCEVLINRPEAIEALQFYSDLRNVYKVVPPDVATWSTDEILAGGRSGRYAMSFMSNTFGPRLADPSVSKTAGKWGWAELPVGPSTKQEQGSGPSGGFLVGIPSADTSDKKDLAWRFIQFVTNRQAQMTCAEYGSSPARESSWKNNQLRAKWPWADVTLAGMKHGTAMYSDPGEIEAEDALMLAVSQALLGEKTPREALDLAAAKMKKIIKDRNLCSK